MKKIAIIFLVLVVGVSRGQSKTYFLSSEGNDSNSGLSIHDPWKSLEKVNQVIFKPGDKLLLKSGEIWKGQMKPQGKGAEGNPIVISSYGGGKRPVIDIDAAEGAAIRLVNQSWWEIRNLEVTSGEKPELGVGRQGIVALFEGNNAGIEHIIIENCYIHDVWGQMGPNTEYNGYNSAAIYVGTVLGSRESRQNSYYDDILIQNNRIERVDKCGIVVYLGRNNVIVRNNYLENLGGDAIFVNGPNKGLIEYNIARRSCMRSGDPDLEGGEDFWPHTAAMWIQNTEETIMQYNEVYDTGRQPKNGDGFAYDFDFDAKNCILQYNYSQNNHGFLLIMSNTFGNITRYNISENDQTHLIQMHGNIEDQNLIHNNVFYVDYGTIDLDFYGGGENKDKVGAYFRNNIFYAHGQGRFRTVYTSGDVIGRIFDDTYKVPPAVAAEMYLNNSFYGTWLNGIPEDPQRILEDPMFVAAGTGGDGLSTLGGYKLRPESPLINAGIPIAFVDHDFYGNPIDDGLLDVGVYEQIGSGVFGDPKVQEELNQKEKARLHLKWGQMSFPQRIIAPEEGGEVLISLSEPLLGDISGTIKINGGNLGVRPQAIDISKTRRDNFAFRFKETKNLNSQPAVSVLLKENGLEERFELPIYYSRNRDFKKLDNYVIDGKLDEWDNIPSLDINSKSQVFSSSKKWSSSDDGSSAFKAAISGENLIISVEVIDKQIITEGPTRDNVEIFYRNISDGQERMSNGGTISLSAQQEDGPIEELNLRAGRREIQTDSNIKTYYKKSPNGYVIEFSVPFQILGFNSKPTKGTEIGFEVVVTNALDEGSNKYQIHMSGTGSETGFGRNNVFHRYKMK